MRPALSCPSPRRRPAAGPRPTLTAPPPRGALLYTSSETTREAIVDGARHTATPYVFQSPEGDCDIWLWKLSGGGHVWPSSNKVALPDGLQKACGAPTTVLDANATMWNFFRPLWLPQTMASPEPAAGGAAGTSAAAAAAGGGGPGYAAGYAAAAPPAGVAGGAARYSASMAPAGGQGAFYPPPQSFLAASGTGHALAAAGQPVPVTMPVPGSLAASASSADSAPARLAVSQHGAAPAPHPQAGRHPMLQGVPPAASQPPPGPPLHRPTPAGQPLPLYPTEALLQEISAQAAAPPGGNVKPPPYTTQGP